MGWIDPGHARKGQQQGWGVLRACGGPALGCHDPVHARKRDSRGRCALASWPAVRCKPAGWLKLAHVAAPCCAMPCCAVFCCAPRSKARNVMLSTGSTDGRGIVGKVGDFGLSLKMDVHETHVSQVFQGTLSHMAPGACVRCTYTHALA